MAVAAIGKFGTVDKLTGHNSWEAVTTPTNRATSVRNRALIDHFRRIFLCCHFAFMNFLLV